MSCLHRALWLGVLGLALAVLAAPAFAQDAASKRATISEQEKQKREQELRDWTEKNRASMEQQLQAKKKRDACAREAKVQKLHFKKRRDFIKACVAR